MQDKDLPAALSPCLRIFLEILCNQGTVITSDKSEPFFPFEEVAPEPQEKASSIQPLL
jgi:hypothetical protein